jgi:hypothetical protein
MVKGGSRLGPTLESFDCPMIAGKVFRKKFESHEATQPRVLGFEDHTRIL